MSAIITINKDSKRQLECMIREKFDQTEWMYSSKWIELAESLGLDELAMQMKSEDI